MKNHLMRILIFVSCIAMSLVLSLGTIEMKPPVYVSDQLSNLDKITSAALVATAAGLLTGLLLNIPVVYSMVVRNKKGRDLRRDV